MTYSERFKKPSPCILLTKAPTEFLDCIEEIKALSGQNSKLILNVDEESFNAICENLNKEGTVADICRVTEPFDPNKSDEIEAFFSSQELSGITNNAPIIMATRATTNLNATAMRAAKNAGVCAICHPTTSLPRIDINAAEEQGIAVFNTKANGLETAAYAFSRAVEHLFDPEYKHPLLKSKDDSWSQGESMKKLSMDALKVRVDSTAKECDMLRELLSYVGAEVSSAGSSTKEELDVVIHSSRPQQDGKPFLSQDEHDIYHMHMPLETKAEAALAFARLNMFQATKRDVKAINESMKTFCPKNLKDVKEGDLQVGVAGYGSVGKPLAGMFSRLGVQCTVARTSGKLNQDEAPNTTFVDNMQHLAQGKNLVVNALPDQDEKPFNKEFFDIVEPGFHLVSVGGRNTVDEAELGNAILHKQVSAEVDTHAKEGKDHSSCLYDLKNAKMTHHIAGVGRVLTEKGNPARAELIQQMIGGKKTISSEGLHESLGAPWNGLTFAEGKIAAGR